MNLYESTYSTLLETDRAARVGHLHPSLIPTKKLQQIMRQMVDQHLEYEFPIPIAHDGRTNSETSQL